MNDTLTMLLAAIACYLIGNVSPAIILGKVVARIDIRKHGSGNAGTTNVLRTLGVRAALVTLVIDISKGVAAVLIGRHFGGEDLAMLCGLAAFIGHIWPVFYGFKGGKGIATAAGVIVTVEPFMGLLVAGVALSAMAVSRRVSVGALLGALSLPFIGQWIDPKYLSWGVIICVIVVFKHRANIKRLIRGEEPTISFRKK